MTKGDFIDFVVERKELTSRKDAHYIIDGFIDCVKAAVDADGEVNIQGFGKFVIVDQKARVAMNPSLGTKVNVPAKKALKFRVSGLWKRAVGERLNKKTKATAAAPKKK